MKAIPKVAQAAVAALILTLLVALLLYLPYFSDLEDATNDHLLAMRYWLDKKWHLHQPDSRLAVAAIDDRTLLDLGGTWPLPRLAHGEFLSAVAPEKPKVVGWDVFFTEHSGVPENGDTLSLNDRALVQGSGLVPRMVTAARREHGSTTPLTDLQSLLPTHPFRNVIGNVTDLISYPNAGIPFPELRQGTYFGFADDPGRVRRVMPLVVNVNGHVLPTFDCQVLMQYWGVDPDQVTVDLGHAVSFPQADGTVLKVPIDRRGNMMLSYRATLGDFHPMSYSRMARGLLDKQTQAASEDRNHLPPIRGNILIVGVTIAGTDAGMTPLEANCPLMVTHLNVLNNILQRDFLLPLTPWIWMPAYAFFLFCMGGLMLQLRVMSMLGVELVGMMLLALAGISILFLDNLQMPLAMPELGLILLGIMVPARGFFGEEREKARIKGIMQAYLSDKVMQKILEHPDNLKLGGVKQIITVMFCDIRGFTAYCDERDPQETMDVLNDYMETMTQVVFEHDGTIDKYIGDCIMAFWNAPEPQPDHAQKAVECAMNMRSALVEFQKKRLGTDVENFECGIGIHTGEALVGNMGSSLKRNYTAMGSTVNLASRLESLTKKLGERIVISWDTFILLQGNLPVLDRREVAVAGVARPVHVYAVVSPAEYALAHHSAQATALNGPQQRNSPVL